MANFLQRALAPLTTEEWERLDRIVAEAAQEQCVGRKVLEVFGPLGAGHQYVPRLSLAGATLTPEHSAEQGYVPVHVGARSQVPLTLIYKDFVLHWHDLELAHQLGIPLDLAAAAAASAVCAAREDELIFQGDKALGIEGFCTATGRHTMTRHDWGVSGHAFLDVVAAVEYMASVGFYPPYALVCSPNLYACLLRVYGSSGVLELTQVRELCTAGVYQSAHVKSAVLLATGAQNFDLVIGLDRTVAYVGSQDLDHRFRVLETIALRIKQAGAICSLVPRSATPGHRVRRGVPEEATGVGD